MRIKNNVVDILNKKVINENGCWEFTGLLNSNGYGYVSVDNKKYLVHRLSFEYYTNSLIDNLNCLHKCDNPKCFNPEHLFLGTQKDNIQDMIRKGRHKNSGTRKRRSSITYKPKEKINSIPSHCKLGHDLSLIGFYTYASGQIMCKKCNKLRKNKFKFN